MTTNEIGRITEAKVLARFVEKGEQVLVPFANVGRYDLLIDTGEKVIRVECKTARRAKGCIIFNTASRGGYAHLPQKPYDGDADVFGVWSPDTNKVYLVPVKDASRSAMYLRIEEPNPRSNRSQIKWAKAYEF